MDDLTHLAQRLGAALQGNGSAADNLLLLHATTYALAFLAGLLIPLGLLYFGARRRDFPFRGLLWLFAAAFGAYALSQALALWGLWQPDTRLLGTAQSTAAALLLSAALGLWMHLPDVVRLPSIRQLRRANADLTRETWEQQRALQEAQDEATLLRGLVAQSTVGTAVLTPAGRWLHVNTPFAEVCGLPREELLTRDPQTLLDAALLDPTRDTLDEERENSAGHRLRWHLSAIRDHAGKVRARLLQCRDVSALKRAEQELERVRRDHELREEERNREAAATAAQLAQAVAAREQGEAELAARTERLERNAAQLEQLGTRLGELAGSDPQTGLLSSHALAVDLERALARAKRHGRGFSVLLLAADPVDDLEPHSAPLLTALGSVVRAELRETDAAARCDQERICVLLPETNAESAARIAERVRRRLATTPFANAEGRNLRLTCCAGLAEWRTGQGLGEVLGLAAENLRQARSGGRGGVCATEAVEENAMRRAQGKGREEPIPSASLRVESPPK